MVHRCILSSLPVFVGLAQPELLRLPGEELVACHASLISGGEAVLVHEWARLLPLLADHRPPSVA